MTWTAASPSVTQIQMGALTPHGAGQRPRLPLPSLPMKLSTLLLRQPLPTPRLCSSVMVMVLAPPPTVPWEPLTQPPAWRLRGLASRYTPQRTSPARCTQEAAPVPVLAGVTPARGHARVRVVGGARCWRLPVLLQAQGVVGSPLGPAEGQPQTHDVSEAGPSAAQLCQDRRNPQGQTQAHLPV